MFDGNLAQRLITTGHAIREQEQAAGRLVQALSQLAIETELIAAVDGQKQQQEQHMQHAPTLSLPLGRDKTMSNSDAILPGSTLTIAAATPMPRSSTSVFPRAVWLDEFPQKPKNNVFEHGHRLQEYADAVARRKLRESSGRIFADPNELREQIRNHLTQDDYEVTQLFKDSGVCQAIVRKPWFEMASMALMVANSVWMAVALDHNNSPVLHDADPIFQVMDHLFCLVFLAELLIRLGAFRRLRDSMRDHWIALDVALVVLFVVETWILGTIAAVSGVTLGGRSLKLIVIFRVLRLARIARLAHILHHLPELMVIARGLLRALRAIALVLALLALIIYVGAIMFKGVLQDTTLGREWFTDVATSMGTLMLECTLSGSRGTTLMRAAWAEHPIFGMMLLVFVLISNITMLGVLTGLLVQTVKTVAEVEREEKSVKQLVSSVEELWTYVLETNGGSLDGKIDEMQFTDLMSEKETALIMHTLEVDVVGLASVSAFVFEQHGGRISRKDFLQMVLDLRNSKRSTVKDHIETRKFFKATLLRLLRGTSVPNR